MFILKFSIVFLQKLQVFGHWNGYKWSNDNLIEIPWFQVKRNGYFLWGDYLNYDVTLLGFDEAETSCYKIVGLQGKSEFKIVSRVNKLIAEVCHYLVYSILLSFIRV